MHFLCGTNETVLLPLRAVYLALLFRYVICLPINITNSISLETLLDGLSLNGSLNASRASCASSPNEWPEWYQPSEKFDWGDVDRALDVFYNDYVRDHGSAKYEFLLSRMKPVHQIPTQRLPLKFEWGKWFM